MASVTGGDFGKEQPTTIVQSPEFNESKQLGECESSRTQSTPALLTNDNSMLEDGGNKINDSINNNSYNQASVKFKRKLVKTSNTPTAANEPGSKPSSTEQTLGLENQGSSFNSRSELRQGSGIQPTIDQDQSILKKQYVKSQLNEFAA